MAVNRLERFWNKPTSAAKTDVQRATGAINVALAKIEELQERLRSVAQDEAEMWRHRLRRREAELKRYYGERDAVIVLLAAVAGCLLGCVLMSLFR
ncbi:MAG TPA: hypothetical protein VF306_09135 [Pirellulales bacterium]